MSKKNLAIAAIFGIGIQLVISSTAIASPRFPDDRDLPPPVQGRNYKDRDLDRIRDRIQDLDPDERERVIDRIRNLDPDDRERELDRIRDRDRRYRDRDDKIPPFLRR
ncbi:MAG: hypothetical protein ACR9NN_16320 [Nostochopsis sp.]